VNEDPAATPEEQEQAPDDLQEHQEAEGQGHGDDEMPGGGPPSDPIDDA